ncbi:MAG: 30S ribosome-binding factor RbfA [Bacteroidota bacterium]|nr:30S ribosome-binding factor RbfA [Bacteroidota bacterium]
MESQRQQKISRLIQKDLGEIFQKSGYKYDNAMITVTRVNVTKDLSIAKVYLSLFATSDKAATVNKVMEDNKEIRFELGKRVRHQLRIIPNLQFVLDDSLDYIENIDNLLDDK